MSATGGWFLLFFLISVVFLFAVGLVVSHKELRKRIELYFEEEDKEDLIESAGGTDNMSATIESNKLPYMSNKLSYDNRKQVL